MNGNLNEAIQSLAADNARLCERLIEAEKVVDAARLVGRENGRTLLRKAIENYDSSGAS